MAGEVVGLVCKLLAFCVGLVLFSTAKAMKAKRAKGLACPKCGGPMGSRQFGASLNCQECGAPLAGVAIFEGAVGCCGIGLIVLFGFILIGWVLSLIGFLLQK